MGIGFFPPGFGSPACVVSGLVGLSLRGAWAGAHTVWAPACMNKRELAPWGSPPVLLETVSLCALRLEGREGGGFEALAARRLHQYCICFRVVYPHGPSLPQYFANFAGTAFGGTCKPPGHSQAPLSPASGPACLLVVFLDPNRANSIGRGPRPSFHCSVIPKKQPNNEPRGPFPRPRPRGPGPWALPAPRAPGPGPRAPGREASIPRTCAKFAIYTNTMSQIKPKFKPKLNQI